MLDEQGGFGVFQRNIHSAICWHDWNPAVRRKSSRISMKIQLPLASREGCLLGCGQRGTERCATELIYSLVANFV